MEEIASLFIQRGCKLARELDSNLPNLADQPNILSKSCDEIISAFRAAKERLHGSTQDTTSLSHMIFRQPQESQQPQTETSLKAGWRSPPSYTQPIMDMLQMQLQADRSPFKMRGLGSDGLVAGVGGREAEGSARSKSIGGEVQPMDASDSGNIVSSSQRQRRRKDDGERRTITAAAPRIGNTDIPPEDGFTWRKYGQKEILGSKFPRGYYRCTHQRLYQCPAKKQVQRLDDDPYTFEVTYRGEHTCHMSSTAPSVPPPAAAAGDITHEITQIITTQPAQSPSVPLSTWLSMEYLGLRGGGSNSINVLGGGGGGGGGGAGPSTTRTGKEVEFPVADMADVMFNSGSSSSNISMDFLFHSNEDKWEKEDKQS
ncbi:WRKY transcription factor 55 [Alnus glutinosa]|uniref:WRKY transcription factor 55 n=1 Tax=Alnus glutinosa TaxID=3517 RepID=UPI002D78649E|nr:WRKY transcription factor 55 [Alnus glutinosa]